MNTKTVFVALLACALLFGCAKRTRSISHSEYSPQAARSGYPGEDNGADTAFEYRGELSEFDVLGLARGEIASEADIQRALDTSKRIRLQPGTSILLIQSGALFPDGPMVAELSKHFAVVPFSGVPPLRKTAHGFQTESLDPESYSKSLRLAAARGGNDMIVCYWGMLESASENLPTRTVSWVPVVNWLLPDEVQHMHLRLKIALIDVRSGHWTVFSPKPLESDRISMRPRRGAVDQRQVERLKLKAYEAGVKELLDSTARS